MNLKKILIQFLFCFLWLQDSNAGWKLGAPFTKGVIQGNIETLLPFYLGAGAEVSFNNRSSYGISLGYIPSFYLPVLGSQLDLAYGGGAHHDFLQGIYKQNFSMNFNYSYRSGDKYIFGLSYLITQYSGTTNLTDLQMAEKKDYSTYIQTLASLESQQNLNISGFTQALILQGQYKILKKKTFSFYGVFGVGKILNNTVEISSEKGTYSSSNVGQTQLTEVKNDLNSFYLDPGVIPFLGLSVKF